MAVDQRVAGAELASSDSLGLPRRLAGYGFGVAVPLILTAGLRWTDELHGLPTEAMLYMGVVVATAMVGGLVPAIVAAVLSGLLLNFFLTPPVHTFTIAEPENALAILLFVVVGIAVASVVDTAARRTTQARRARSEADALTALSHRLLNASDDLSGLLVSACQLFDVRGAAIFRSSEDGQVVLARAGDAPATLPDAGMVADVDENTVLALTGEDIPVFGRGLLDAYAAYARVIDERRRANEAEVERLRLTEADRTRTALLAAVSHDLRSPLAVVRAAVDGLRSTDIRWSPEDEAELLETIAEATDRLTSLVTNLLDMSRINTGSVSTALTEIDLRTAVRDSVRPLGEAERIEVDIPAELVVVADPVLLDRVVFNICENALKYTPETAVIQARAVPSAGRGVLRIADTGPGVPDQDHERLFAPFQRLGDVPKQDGVGLGLAVARGLTEAMGGSIVSEQTPGGGLTFVVDLPLAEDER